jgi:hypothetical protein
VNRVDATWDARLPDHGIAGSRTWRAERRLGGSTFVVVMQATNVWDLNNRTEGRWLRHPRDGSIFVQREVSSPFMIINEAALQVAAQGALVPDDDVIEALAREGADHDAASVVREHHEHKQDTKGGGGDREEVDRGELGL